MTETNGGSAPRFPRPVILDYVAFLYEGFNRKELRIQYCDQCGRHRHPPSPLCPHCHSVKWTAKPTSGRGRVYSYTVQYHPPIPPHETPHPVVLADMDEGFRFLAAMRGVALDAICIGMPVAVGFVELESGFTLPVFRPAQGAA
jgi:uncharacterized OB-fold protein